MHKKKRARKVHCGWYKQRYHKTGVVLTQEDWSITGGATALATVAIADTTLAWLKNNLVTDLRVHGLYSSSSSLHLYFTPPPSSCYLFSFSSTITEGSYQLFHHSGTATHTTSARSRYNFQPNKEGVKFQYRGASASDVNFCRSLSFYLIVAGS